MSIRKYHYLATDGYTIEQRIAFERERIAVMCLCSLGGQTHVSIAKIIGVYQARQVLKELHEDGYLIRYHHTPTGETRYKTNPASISANKFFLQGDPR